MALATVLVLLSAACGRSGSPPQTASSASSSAPSAGTSQSRLDSGAFGDLTKVCSSADANGQKASGATARGVTDSEIHVGTVTDKGSDIRAGLDKEMFDSAVAFTSWCNQHGGILGRKLVLDDLDAKLFSYNDVITKACNGDFSLVGGGAVFDDGDNGQRVQCGLPNIAGFVTSATARRADLLVQPVPNPVDKLPIGGYLAVDRIAPGALQHYGVLTGNVTTTQQARDQNIEGVEKAGGTAVYNAEFNVVSGESNWAPFIDDMKSKGVRAFEIVSDPGFLQQIQAAMVTANFFPDVTIVNTNFYDSKFAQEGGANAKNTYIRSIFFPLELKDENAATADYLAMMQQFNPSGKVAQLGLQGMSAWLLFAQAATACGSQLTPQCLLDKSKVSTWTGGGLHAPTGPGTNSPSSCFLLMTLAGTKFVYDEKDTQPNQGKFNCSDANVVTLTKSVPK
ncbi:MAG TPA: ABC transporter substrate-binding protein [Acidimicrobiales bacterium]|nr:ABC transporter substrate-binding protein [Acidimicrobiales bacterium]